MTPSVIMPALACVLCLNQASGAAQRRAVTPKMIRALNASRRMRMVAPRGWGRMTDYLHIKRVKRRR
jgi:hypothetical protein